MWAELGKVKVLIRGQSVSYSPIESKLCIQLLQGMVAHIQPNCSKSSKCQPLAVDYSNSRNLEGSYIARICMDIKTK